MTPDLFESAGVEVRNPERESVSHRKRVRSLLARVEALVGKMDPDFPVVAQNVARRAELLGAHSVARAIRWYARMDTLDCYGYDATTIRLMRITKRWVRREEETLG